MEGRKRRERVVRLPHCRYCAASVDTATAHIADGESSRVRIASATSHYVCTECWERMHPPPPPPPQPNTHVPAPPKVFPP